MSGPRGIACLILSLFSAYVFADTLESTYKTQRSPTMAAFYSVADTGRSVREAVDTAIIADPNARPFRVRVTGRPRQKDQVEIKEAQVDVVAGSVKSNRRDSFAAFRCERHGFYYTRNGDCVQPSWSQFYLSRKYERGAGRVNASPSASQSVRVRNSLLTVQRSMP
jgi:hypothetical protein